MDDNPKEQERESFFEKLSKKFSRRQQEKKAEAEEQEKQDKLDAFVEDGADKGIIEVDEMELLKNAIHFSEKEVQDVMIHKTAISSVDGELTIARAFDRIMEDGFSRYPVYIGDRDNIVGMLHIRDFLRAFADPEERDTGLKESKHEPVQPIEVVPETKKISNLFKEMQMDKRHMAVVKDEYGQLLGIVTMEDMVEEIFGNIWDEHDEADTGIEKTENENIFTIDGSALLKDVETELEIEFEDDDIETMNGFITAKLGHVPEESDVGFAFVYSGYSFTVAEVENRLVKEVTVERFEEKNTD